MHVQKLLQNFLSSVMHQKRLTTLIIMVMTALKTKKLSLTDLGRAIDLPIAERSCIRRSDRFLSNKKLHMEREIIHITIVRKIIGARNQPDIIVDWSAVPNTTHHILRAAMVGRGRALTLYEEVHPEKKLGNKRVQNKFLQTLKTILPASCSPVIITDAGFHNDWFKKVSRLGWHYLGRIRGKKHVRILANNSEWQPSSSLFSMANSTPKCLGKTELCESNPCTVNLCLFKAKKKGRKGLTRSGKKRTDKNSLQYSKSAKEPWVLATSLPENRLLANRAIKKYQKRMEIEESFRDLKSSRFGFGFENSYSKKINRIEILLLVAMLASLVAWLTGLVSEKRNIHYNFQSNTTKNRRVLSLFFLGCQVIKRKIKIPINELISAFDEELNCAF